jgi:hypothetical protein
MFLKRPLPGYWDAVLRLFAESCSVTGVSGVTDHDRLKGKPLLGARPVKMVGK